MRLPPEVEVFPKEAGALSVLVSLQAEPGSGRWSLWEGGTLALRGASTREALRELEDRVELRFLSATSGLFLHAAVVRWRERALVLPGRSMSGKTTLTQELLAAGAEYGSDEFAYLDEEGQVHPYRRALSIRGAGAIPIRRRPRGGGACRFTEPAPAALFVLAPYQPGAVLDVKRMRGSAAALSLLRHAPGFRAHPDQAMRVMTRALQTARVYAGTRGSARQAATALLALMERQGVEEDDEAAQATD